MKPLADGFIALIQLAIAPLIFLVVATGVAQVGDMRKVGRIGLKAIIYFEAVTTIALLIGLAVGNLVHFSNGVAEATPAQAASVAQYSKAHAASLAEFLTQIIPNNLFGAFVHENVLQVLVIALLVGAAIVRLGDAGAKIRGAMDAATSVIFGVVNIIVAFAPIGAFGALGFTVGRFGVATLYSLGLFVLTSWLALAAFVFIVLGLICRLAGVSLLDLLGRLKREMIVTFATSSSESAMPGMMERLQQCGIARPVVGLVVPTGFSFNLDGVAITLPMSVLFIAQVYGIQLDMHQQISLVILMLFTAKGAAGVTGGAFASLAATVIASGLPIEGLALLLGIDRFMSLGRAFVNVIGNSVAAIVVAKWDGGFDAITWNATRALAPATPSAASPHAAPASHIVTQIAER